MGVEILFPPERNNIRISVDQFYFNYLKIDINPL